MVLSIAISNNSVCYRSLVCTQLNDETVLFQTNQFCISHLFVQTWDVKPIWPIDRTVRCYSSEPGLTWKRWQWRGTPHSPKLQYYLSLSIRLLSVISRTLVAGRGFLPLCRDAVGVFYNPSRQGGAQSRRMSSTMRGIGSTAEMVELVMSIFIFWKSFNGGTGKRKSRHLRQWVYLQEKDATHLVGEYAEGSL